MKQANVIASVILAAAVLLAAYAIGRLIRQARLDVPETSPGQVVEPNDSKDPNIAEVGRPALARRNKTTPEDRARVKETRAQELARHASMTEEEKAKYRDETLEEMRSRRSKTPGQVPHLSPDELARWAQMSDEEKAALRARLQGGRRERPVEAPVEANQPSTRQTATPEPNAAGPN